MILIVDEEAKKIINQLVDISLKQAGISNLEASLYILNNMKDYTEQPKAIEMEEEK